MAEITARISDLRTAAGLSESRLADQSGISRTTFQRRLAHPAAFTLEEIERLARVLDVDPTWLWRGAAA
jgi:transcriptional regulator with XRE-family HTH domain